MMRLFAAALGMLFVAQTAYAMNFKATTRADHQTLDVVVRRLSNVSPPPDDVKASLRHLQPVLDRHGGPIGWGGIELGSEDELDLICAQHGYANTSESREDLREDIAIGFFRWIKNMACALVVAAGPWVVACVVVYVMYRRRTAEQLALHQRIEESIPHDQRIAHFAGNPLIERAHKRLKARLCGKT